MLSWLTDPQAWVALFTLTALEIVLGVDNIIILTILVGRLPPQQRQFGRIFGLGMAMCTRILLLFSLVWVMQLTVPLFNVLGKSFSGRDLILIIGGLFLIAKSTHEIHQSMEGEISINHDKSSVKANFISLIIQIALIDIVFSLDSVITAVGLVKEVSIMILAIIISMVIMMMAAKAIGEFVDKHPTIKMLALSFLILIGVILTTDGMGLNIPKGYIYFAMAFSVSVEMLNLKLRSSKTSS